MKEFDKIIVTEHDEVMFCSEAKKYDHKIKRDANETETNEFLEEKRYWDNEHRINQHEASYHELPD